MDLLQWIPIGDTHVGTLRWIHIVDGIGVGLVQ